MENIMPNNGRGNWWVPYESFKREQSLSILTNQHRGKALILGSAGSRRLLRCKKSNAQSLQWQNQQDQFSFCPNVTLVDMTKRNNFTQHQFLSDHSESIKTSF